jgi:hypothetical protein
MERTADTGVAPIVRKLLWADAALELVIAVALVGILGDPAEWLDVSPAAVWVAAGVFLVAAAAVAGLAAWRSTTRGLVQQLAVANVLGGMAVWAVALAFWGRFEVEGRTLVALAADGFILVGILEWLALRRTA